MLQTIKNATNKFVAMGVLTKQVVAQKRVQKVYYKLSEIYRSDNDKLSNQSLTG